MSNSEFASLWMDRWIRDNKYILILNFVSLFAASALGRNPLVWALLKTHLIK